MVEFLFLTELSARNTSIFYFQDDNFSNSQWIFTKFDVCIDIMEVSALGLLIGKFRPFLTVICPRHDNGGVLSFHVFFVCFFLTFYPFFFFFFFFLIWVLRPFQEYFTYIEPNVHRSWVKTGEPGEKPPDHP